MADAEQDQKTEEPTGRRLGEARDKGNLAVSREMSSWFMIVGILLVVSWFGPALATSMKVSLKIFLEKPHQISLEDGGLQNVLMGVVSASTFTAILTFGILLVAAVLGTMIQTDFYVGTGKLKFDITKLSPMKGIQNLFSMNSVSELVKSFSNSLSLAIFPMRFLNPSL